MFVRVGLVGHHEFTDGDDRGVLDGFLIVDSFVPQIIFCLAFAVGGVDQRVDFGDSGSVVVVHRRCFLGVGLWLEDCAGDDGLLDGSGPEVAGAGLD
ncbi:hypothetical protein [Nocardia salmonicida]|uniref:hypothetical protein n=1 Tax=Nocardia salmonicida TaxID=53431 RepID=UPI0033EE0663